MKVKSEREVAQFCPTLSDPMDCSLPGSSVHGIFQARALEWGVISGSLGYKVFIRNQHLGKKQVGDRGGKLGVRKWLSVPKCRKPKE